MLAVAYVLDGLPRAEAAQSCGMEGQTLRNWVHGYNADGIEGLSNRTSPGRPAALDPGQMARFKALFLDGPDRAKYGAVRWHCSDLRSMIAEEFEVEMHERTADIVCESSTDMSRFLTAGHLIFWVKLCPRDDESAGKRRSTRLRKGTLVKDYPDTVRLSRCSQKG